MNLYGRDRLIPYSLTFTERKTTSPFCSIQTNRSSDWDQNSGIR